MFPEGQPHVVCLILNILSVKKDAKSLHNLLDNSLEGSDAVRLISLSIPMKSVRASLFLLIIYEKNDCLAFFSSWL